MSDCSGLMLQPQIVSQSITTAQPVTIANLLIVADSSDDITLIVKTLEAAKIAFTYEIATAEAAYRSLLPENLYNGILFNYPLNQDSDHKEALLKIVQCLEQSEQDIPLIAIAEVWEDEKAVEYMRLGITDYLVKDRLFLLPEILRRSLLSFARRRQQAIINRITQAMGETLVVDDILQTAVDLIEETFGVTHCLILRPDSENTMRVPYFSKATVKRKRKSLLDLCCQVFNDYHSLLVQDRPLAICTIDEFQPLIIRKAADKIQLRSLLIVPLFYQHSYLGGICLHHCQWEHQWSEDELKIVRNIASQCAIAIHQAQLLEEVQRQRQREQLLNQITQKLNSSLEPEKILQEIIRIIGESFEVDQVVLFHLDKDRIRFCKQWRVNDQIPSLLNIKTQSWKWLELVKFNCKAQKGQIFNHQSWGEWTETEKKRTSEEIEDFQPYSVLSMPIFIREQFFGSLTLQTALPSRAFTPGEIETIKLIVQLTAIALDNFQRDKNLEQLVKGSIQKLEEEKQNAEAASRSKSEFLSHMTHELRTPLTAILGFSRMLLDEIYGPLNQKQMRYVNGIADSGKHLLELVNDFLDISKIEADREELFLEKVPVEDVCLASASIVEERARQEGLELKLEIGPQVDFCRADQRRLKQILVNLLSNAIKFTETGSVTLKVEKNRKTIEFSVIDTGIGICEADQKKLFQPFEQINNCLSRKYKGTGLGLALSRKLARLHGGDLTLTSEESKGSCFTLHLPI